jgi:hypothetical protein
VIGFQSVDPMNLFARTCLASLFTSVVLLGSTWVDDAPRSFRRSIFSLDSSIREKNFVFVSDRTRFQKFTFNGKRGDFISLELHGPVVALDVEGDPFYGDGKFLRLLFDTGQGLETAPEVGDKSAVSFEFSEDKLLTIYVATKQPEQTGKYHLEVETATRLAPAPIYMHFPKKGETLFEHTMNFDCVIANELGLEVEATGVDFLPIIEFGTGIGPTFQSLGWSERRERRNTVWAKAEGPPGNYTVRVSPQRTVGGSFDLVFMLPQKLRPNP